MSIIDLEHQNRDLEPRARWLITIITLGFLVLGSRLWYLQVVKGEDYFRYAARNSFKAREIPAPRGIIFDAQGNRIADVRPSFDVVIRPDRIRRAPPGHEHDAPVPGDPVDIRTLAQLLSTYLGISPASVEEKFYSASGRARYKALVVKGDVTRDEIAVIEAHRIELPGVDIQVSQKRTYPYGELFSHLVGYLGEVHKEELARLREIYRDSKGEDYYEMGDFIGKYGVEKQYESSLKGQDGVYYVQEDASGRVLNAFDQQNDDDEEYARTMLAYLSERRRPAVGGHDISLTVDLELQRFVKEQMGDKVGTVIAMEPDTGRILAMVNNPSFDPEIFARGLTQEEWEKLRDDPAHPLEDKALRGQYPPGSTFKMIPAAAALMENVATADTQYFCAGSMQVGGRRFRCHKAGGHGFVDIHHALVYSCDVFFYSLGTKLGIDRLARYASAFGLGQPTGLGLNGEKSGLVPTETWKMKVFKQPWVTGDTVSASIGQGFNLLTPLQLARFTTAIANGGRLMRPYVVEKIQTVEGKILQEVQPEVVGKLPVSPRVLKIIQNGMLGVVEEEGGTAVNGRIKGIQVAGKTGTAQVVRQDTPNQGINAKNKALRGDHAWYTAYAPFDHPQIVVTVLVEHGGHGGSVAAPIARNVMRKFFQDRGQLPRTVAAIRTSSPDASGGLEASSPAMADEPSTAED